VFSPDGGRFGDGLGLAFQVTADAMQMSLCLGGAHGVSSLDTPELESHCLVMFVAYTSKLN